MMVEGLGVHGTDQRDVVGASCDVWNQVRELYAALAMLGELATAAHDARYGQFP